jgi:hypothetical protein
MAWWNEDQGDPYPVSGGGSMPSVTGAQSGGGDMAYTQPIGMPSFGSGQSFGGGNDPYLSNLMDFINSRQNAGPTGLEHIAGYFQGGWQNPFGEEINSTLRKLLEDAQKPAFTATEDAARRAAAFTGIESNRDTGLTRAKQTLASLGHGQKSGTIADALSKVNTSADQARAGAERDLVIEGAAKTERQRGMAANITQMMQQIAAQTQQINDARMGQSAQIHQAMANLENQRAGQMLQMLTLPIELQDRRLGQAMNLLNMGGGMSNPQSLMSGLMQLIGQSQQSGYANDQRNASLWGGIGSAMGNMDWSRLFGGGQA